MKKSDIKKTKLDILNQTRDRDPMPRPTVFRDKKKYETMGGVMEDTSDDLYGTENCVMH